MGVVDWPTETEPYKDAERGGYKGPPVNRTLQVTFYHKEVPFLLSVTDAVSNSAYFDGSIRFQKESDFFGHV